MTDKPTYEELEQRVRDLEQARSELKLIEGIICKSEERYSRLFHSSNDGILIHDLEGNIIDANQKVLELFGYTKAEISTIKILMLHPAEALEKSKWAFKTIIRDGSVRFEIDFKKKNGELFSAEFRQVCLKQKVIKLSRVLSETFQNVSWQKRRCRRARNDIVHSSRTLKG